MARHLGRRPCHRRARRAQRPVGHPGRRIAAAATGTELVAASRSSQEHSICAAEPWATGWVFGDLLAGGVAPYHPDAAGMAAVAELLVDQLTHGPAPSGTQPR